MSLNVVERGSIGEPVAMAARFQLCSYPPALKDLKDRDIQSLLAILGQRWAQSVIVERKWDGMRVMVRYIDGSLTMYSKGSNATQNRSLLAQVDECLRQAGVASDVVFDCELVGEEGHPERIAGYFKRVNTFGSAVDVKFKLVVFDCLQIGIEDISTRTLIERKEQLGQFKDWVHPGTNAAAIEFITLDKAVTVLDGDSRMTVGAPGNERVVGGLLEAFETFETFHGHGRMEGVVIKAALSNYNGVLAYLDNPSRSEFWVKFKPEHSLAFQVVADVHRSDGDGPLQAYLRTNNSRTLMCRLQEKPSNPLYNRDAYIRLMHLLQSSSSVRVRLAFDTRLVRDQKYPLGVRLRFPRIKAVLNAACNEVDDACSVMEVCSNDELNMRVLLGDRGMFLASLGVIKSSILSPHVPCITPPTESLPCWTNRLPEPLSPTSSTGGTDGRVQYGPTGTIVIDVPLPSESDDDDDEFYAQSPQAQAMHIEGRRRTRWAQLAKWFATSK